MFSNGLAFDDGSNHLLCKDLKHVGHVVYLKLYKGSEVVKKWFQPVARAMLVHKLAKLVSLTPLIMRSVHRCAQGSYRRRKVSVLDDHINDISILFPSTLS